MTRSFVPAVGAIAIGRNEGDRLACCLAALVPAADQTVYVDSGSTDESLRVARSAGAEIVELDMTTSFTAAKARNAGFVHLEKIGALDFVQFIDGDCEIDPNWIPIARDFLIAHPDVAAVCGRRRERHPELSLWNRLIDAEWNTPVGETRTCGGDALMRAEAFRMVGGFDPRMIAGEEPELCVRLRQAGWRIWRLDAEMTRHDAAMTEFSQWWRRQMRAGHAYAQGAAMHGAPPERHNVPQARRALIWGLALPLVTIFGTITISPWMVLLGLSYPLQVLRLAPREGITRATFLTLGKIAEAWGIITYASRRLRGGPSRLIEYK